MKKSIFLILYNIRSLYNVGAIFRSADAFGVEKIFLCGITAYPPHRQMEKISKTALGAEKTVPWQYYRQTLPLIKKLKTQGIKIIILETKVGEICESPLQKFKPYFPLALVIGNEKFGVNKNIIRVADHLIYIPQQGKKESLNVAIAASIALYEIHKKSG